VAGAVVHDPVDGPGGAVGLDGHDLIHLPVHASWLNQIEIYFSIVQRTAMTPNDFGNLEQLARHLLDFGQHYRTVAEPFQWTFTRAKLDAVIEKITRHEPQPLALAADSCE
jgi:hypothetical protein